MEPSVQSEEVRINQLHEKLELGDEKMPAIKSDEGVLIMGKSNIGKTTLLHMIVGNKLESKLLDDMDVVAISDAESAEVKSAELGHGGVSTTVTPNKFVTKVKINDKFTTVIDLAGFQDTNNFAGRIANSYYIYTTFLNVPQTKFILVMTQAALDDGMFAAAIHTIKIFLNYFIIALPGQPTNENQISIEDIAKRTILVINKAGDTLQQLMPKLNRIVNNNKDNNVGRFLSFFNGHPDKVEVVPKIRAGEQLPPIQIVDKLAKMDYLSRLKPDKTVNMGPINYKLSEIEIQAELPLVEKAFRKNKTDIETLWTEIKNAVQEILKNFSNETYKYTFTNSWNTKIGTVTTINNKKDERLKKPAKYPHFSTMDLVKKIYAVKFDEPLTVEKMQTISFNILKDIAELLPLDASQFEILQKFSYVLNRKYECTKILQKIRQYNFDSMICRDAYQGCMTVAFETIQENLAKTMTIKSGQDAAYYDKAVAIMNTYVAKDKNLLQKISQCEAKKADIMESNKQLFDSLLTQLNAFFTNEKLNEEANKTNYVNVDEANVKKIANLLYEARQFSLAVNFFKILGNRVKVEDCYAKMILLKNTEDQQFNLRMEQGDYYLALTLFEKARDSYDLAFSATSQKPKKIEARKKLLAVHSTADAQFQGLTNKINAGEIYTRLPVAYTKDFLVAELTKNRKAIEQNFKTTDNSDLILNAPAKK